MDSREPTAAQVKAVSNSLRLRILRLCHQREWTNKELADRLDRDPSTILRHLRLLVEAGLIETAGVRQGPSGAYEKPYRSTGRSWHLRFERAEEDEDQPGELAMLSAFRHELADAGNDSIAELTRFHLHLSSDALEEFVTRLKGLVMDLVGDDEHRRERGEPAYGGLFVMHRLADVVPNENASGIESDPQQVAPPRQEVAIPVHRGKDSDGPYYQWGDSGKKYRYTAGDKSSREAAKTKAEKQGKAARASGYEG